MTARVSTIQKWIEQGQESGNAYMITWYDSLDHESYPSFCKTLKDAVDQRDKAREDDQHIEEIYDLNGDIATQLAEHRCVAI